MSRVSISPATQQARTIESSRKRIAQGERPGFNVLVRTSISGLMWVVLGWPEVTGSAMARLDVEPAARASLATILAVPGDAFDVRVDE
jgi:hypothetical protein